MSGDVHAERQTGKAGQLEGQMSVPGHQTFEEKSSLLREQMGRYAGQDVAVAFSGGVDSSLLLKLACEAAEEAGTKVYAVTMATKLHPAGEIKETERIAKEMGAVHLVLPVDELGEAQIMDNPVDRCYRCKRLLFEKLLDRTKALGVETVLEGTNEDDLHVYRPGIRALKELKIVSPLAQVHMTKEEVRRLAAAYGLPEASKPSTPCLATRFPYGTALTYEKMEQVERGESFLKSLGLFNVRLRVHEDIARLEVDEQDLPVLLKNRQAVVRFLKDTGYTYITLDMEGFRSGSMDTGVASS